MSPYAPFVSSNWPRPDRATATVPTQLNLFFIANNASHKFDEIKHDSNVNVSFYDQKTTGWASVSGIAKVSQDKDLIKKYWSPMFVYSPCAAPSLTV